MNPEVSMWLAFVTAGLAPNEQQQTQAEIVEHFEMAVENHEKQGLEPRQARLMALADLGDARQAKIIYEQSYFTEAEHLKIMKLYKPNLWMGFLSIVGLLLTSALTIFLVMQREDFAFIGSIKVNIRVDLTIATTLIVIFLHFCFNVFIYHWKHQSKQVISLYAFVFAQVSVCLICLAMTLQMTSDIVAWLVTPRNGKFIFTISTTPIFLAYLWYWLYQQFPITKKAIRRLRA
jgi:hypothetical protein